MWVALATKAPASPVVIGFDEVVLDRIHLEVIIGPELQQLLREQSRDVRHILLIVTVEEDSGFHQVFGRLGFDQGQGLLIKLMPV
jgi:hypothetical protein